jgi:hypothetical protein
LRAEDGCVGADECVTLAADDGWRQRMSLQLLELRLVIEQVELARSASHKDVNDAFGFGGKMRRPGLERFSRGDGRAVRARDESIGHERSRRDFPQTKAALFEKPPARILPRLAASVEIVVAIYVVKIFHS